MDIWSESLALLPVAFLNQLKIEKLEKWVLKKGKDYADMTSRQVQVEIKGSPREKINQRGG
jgi:hypothetical protein